MKFKAICNEQSNGRKEVTKKSCVLGEKKDRLSPNDHRDSELKAMWDKRKLKKKKAVQSKRLIKKGKSANGCVNNSSHSNEMKAAQSGCK